jgi:hypothetical protein
MSTKTSSLNTQVRLAQTVDDFHPWPLEALPEETTDEDWYTFLKLQQQRTYDDWTPADLIQLAALARMIVDAFEQSQRLREEGHIAQGGKTGSVPIKNPRMNVVNDLNAAINARSRLLGVTHTSQADQRSRANRGAMQRGMRTVLGNDELMT